MEHNRAVIQECKACEELLVQYIQAGNELIDRKAQATQPASRRPTARLIAEAMRRKAILARRLRRHRELHD